MYNCRKCELSLNDSNWHASSQKAHSYICKTCLKLSSKERRLNNIEKYKENDAAYYTKNRPTILLQKQEYYVENSDSILEKAKLYNKNNADTIKERRANSYQENRDIILLKRKQYVADNKEKVREQQRDNRRRRRAKDISFRLNSIISRDINKKLRAVGLSKNGKSTVNYLPYTIDELKRHLESFFEPWMNWNNWGVYNSKVWDDNNSDTWIWQIDHIIPNSTFKYKSMEDEAFRECWALNNLRPLSAKQNYLDGINRKRHI